MTYSLRVQQILFYFICLEEKKITDIIRSVRARSKHRTLGKSVSKIELVIFRYKNHVPPIRIHFFKVEYSATNLINFVQEISHI